MIPNVTDVADSREATTRGDGSPRITAKDRALLLKMLEGDELANLFREIVVEDFGPAAASELFRESDLTRRLGDAGADYSGPVLL